MGGGPFAIVEKEKFDYIKEMMRAKVPTFEVSMGESIFFRYCICFGFHVFIISSILLFFFCLRCRFCISSASLPPSHGGLSLRRLALVALARHATLCCGFSLSLHRFGMRHIGYFKPYCPNMGWARSPRPSSNPNPKKRRKMNISFYTSFFIYMHFYFLLGLTPFFKSEIKWTFLFAPPFQICTHFSFWA